MTQPKPVPELAEPTQTVSDFWATVDRLLERLDADAASKHGVVPLLAERLRRRGEAVPEALLPEERAARMMNLIAPSVLRRARAAYDGPMLVLKGPEIAALYPGRARMLVDLDVMVGDAQVAWDELLGAGFVRALRLKGVSPGFYHMNPIELPGVPLAIELHKTVKSPTGLRPPSTQALFEAAVPAAVDVPGLLAPAPVHHAVLLAGHAWAERPLERLRDLIDVAAVAASLDASELSQVADEWGWNRLWQTTERTIDWLLGEGKRPNATRIWARHLGELRAPTFVDVQLRRWASPFWAMPPLTALHVIAFEGKKALIGPRHG